MSIELDKLLRRLEAGQIEVEEAVAQFEQLAGGDSNAASVEAGRSPEDHAPRSGAPAEQAPSRSAKCRCEEASTSIIGNGALCEGVGNGVSSDDLQTVATRYLQQVIGRVTGLRPEQVEPKEPFERFGIDSMMVTRLNRALEADFGEISKTLFFEFPNLVELARFFVQQQAPGLKRLAGPAAPLKGPAASSVRPGARQDCPLEVEPVLAEAEAGSPPPSADDGIAIIGLAGRYPMAESLDVFWENLKAGRDCVTEIPKDRWDHEAWYDPDKNAKGKCYSRWGAFLLGADRFDARFFNISPREAELMDPQERVFLETAWSALEDAGYTRASLPAGSGPHPAAKVGVFVGAMYAHYHLYGAEEIQKGNPVAPLSAFWSIANRVSYFLNLSGPSLAVDTACSSSLTAIHLACASLRRGESGMALAGGVNLTLHPLKYLILSQGKFASSDGRCRSFGEGGDGYVPGEGAGAVLLRPLADALRNGDHIYGVIRGSAVNHGGKTNGFLVPSPNAQGAVISEALEEARLPADSISYLEAHGTGTALGDPIEISGLAAAFGRTTTRKQFCALGSVKSNIGHLESAAGVAALTKVLLQMKHRTLVPSLHATEINANLNLEKTPFRLQRCLEDWKQPALSPTTDSGPSPLRAGISSFGAGGANAHLIVEEYVPFKSTIAENHALEATLAIVPLSAKSRPALIAGAEQLARHLAENQAEVADVAFTLQVGREAFAERVCFLAADRKELADLMLAFARGAANSERTIGGRASSDSEIARVLGDGEETQTLVDSLARAGKLSKLAALWVNGMDLAWTRLPRNRRAKRISLPTYPFERERFWLPIQDSTKDSARRPGLGANGPLHPLLDRNVTTVDQIRFVKRFEVREWFLREHRVAGNPTLPGACCLEMVRAAAEAFAGTRVATFRNVVWSRPVRFSGESLDIAVHLERQDRVWKFTLRGGDLSPHDSYAQGLLELASSTDDPILPAPFDLDELKRRLGSPADVDGLYARFQAQGLEYGAQFQVVREARASATEALVRVKLAPESAGSAEPGFGLHPALLDGAFQSLAILAWRPDADCAQGLCLPFSLRQMRYFGALPSEIYVHLTAGPKASAEPGTQYDLTILDFQGRVLASLTDLALRRAAVGLGSHAPKGEAARSSLHYFKPVWGPWPAPLSPSPGNGLVLILDRTPARAQALREEWLRRGPQSSGKAVVVLASQSWRELGPAEFEMRFDSREDWRELFKALDQPDNVPVGIFDLRALPLGTESNSDQAGSGAVPAESVTTPGAVLEELLAFAQTAIRARFGGEIRYLRAFPAGPSLDYAGEAALAGFALSLAREQPRLRVVTVELPAEPQSASRLAALFSQAWGIGGSNVFEIRGGDDAPLEPDRLSESGGNEPRPTHLTFHSGNPLKCSRRTLEWLDPDKRAERNGAILRQGGVCLITGGAGGIGLLLAKHLARSYGAKVALVGRAALSEAKTMELEAIRAMGGEAAYFQADVADARSLAGAVAAVRNRFGVVHGVIHSAGVVEDGLVLNKTAAALLRVLAPKVQGSVNLDLATRDEPLEFFVLCSSLASVGGNLGQADYAAANRFLDAFAEVREQWRALGQRRGKTLSINWPYWAEGGMRMDDETLAGLERASGLAPMPSNLGCEALEVCLGLGWPQVVVVCGARARFERFLGLSETGQGVADARARDRSVTEFAGRGDSSGDGSVPRLESFLSCAISAVLKIKPDQVDFAAKWEEFGFDSITLTELASHLERELRIEFTPADLFEHPSPRQLAAFLLRRHGAHLAEVFRPPPAEAHRGAEVPQPRPAAVDGRVGESAQRSSPLSTSASVETAGSVSEPPDQVVAIVGMSGAFPGSPDLDSFWNNLAAGRDLITEIPPDRFDWRAYFGDPLIGSGKTNSRWGGFLADMDKFDAAFFRISPQEAGLMDPRHRLLLEWSWAAIEDAGWRPTALAGTRTGVFVGAGKSDYAEAMERAGVEAAAQYATGIAPNMLPNRLSHLLDLRGPSEPVDTACSSSLVAIHRAVKALQLGECDLALAGGVSVILTPTAYISFSQGGLLSPDGRCKTFDRSANGYARGEGGGVVVLKPLARAVADGDHIYAVIRATAINHGGKGGSLTAPNPDAQAELYVRALKAARLDFSDLDYIEAHGTGTALGDPVEVNGLKLALSRLEPCHRNGRTPACGLGTVKSNIGHLEPAAGMAGLIKVLLALREEQLPPTLHVRELNPYIRLEGTPFHIVTTRQPWPSALKTGTAARPRRAGVNSFGFGGVNAHLIVEEFQPGLEAACAEAPGPELIALSARDPEGLREYARRLAQWLAKVMSGSGAPPRLRDVAFTLQVGRDAREERLALVVMSLEDLAARLNQYLAEQGQRPLQGAVPTRKQAGAALAPATDGALYDECFAGRRWEELGRLWVQGAEIPWEHLYTGAKVRRLSLPTYPFARERHWFTPGSPAPAPIPTEDFVEVRSSTAAALLQPIAGSRTVSVKEFWLDEHRILGVPVVPGAFLLELALETLGEDKSGTLRAVQDISWKRPLRCTGTEVKVEVQWLPQDGGMSYEIRSSPGKDVPICSRGELMLPQTDPRAVHAPADLDLLAIQARCSHRWTRSGLYEEFKARGLAYGPAFQVVEEIAGNATEALARLQLCQPVSPHRLPLHPLLLDGAMQSVAGLFARDGNTLLVPVGIRRIEFFGRFAGAGFAWVTQAAPEVREKSADQLMVDVVLADPAGRVKAILRGLCFQVAPAAQRVRSLGAPSPELPPEPVSWFTLESALVRSPIVAGPKLGPLVLVFEEEDAQFETLARQVQAFRAPGSETRLARVRRGRSFVRLGAERYEVDGTDPAQMDQLLRDARGVELSPIQVIFLWTLPERSRSSGPGRDLSANLELELSQGIRSLSVLCGAMLRSPRSAGAPGPGSVVCVTGGSEAAGPFQKALGGFARALRREAPELALRIVDLGCASGDTAGPVEVVLQELSDAGGEAVEVQYRGGQRYLSKYEAAALDLVVDRPLSVPLREGAVYVISGGFGALGFALAEWLIRKYRAALLLVGRAPLEAKQRELLGRLESAGARVRYVSADVTQRTMMARALKLARQSFGAIHGVFHLAGITRDAYLLRKPAADFGAVLAPKVKGAILLDELTAADPLECFVLFSSLASILGNPGQSDYAYANAFLDAFAEARATRVAAGARRGRTRSINWPYWAGGGISMAPELQALARAESGLEPLDLPSGLGVLEAVLAQGRVGVPVLRGNRRQFEQWFASSLASAGAERIEPTQRTFPPRGVLPESAGWSEGQRGTELPPASRNRLRLAALEFVRNLLVETLHVRARAIEPTTTFEQLGISSITVLKLNALLEQRLGPTSKTLFYEYADAGSLADYLAERFASVLGVGLASEAAVDEPGLALSAPDPRSPSAASELAELPELLSGGASARNIDEPIAIVGISGRYPAAPDLATFWRNLLEGRDCITEVPTTRWNHQQFYDADKAAPGKSYLKWGGFLDDVDKFDPLFFNISPHEADQMDPQERLFLETAWATLEDAGYTRSTLGRGPGGERCREVGVFVGVMFGTYQLYGPEEQLKGNPVLPNSSYWSIANRVSYCFDFQGPSLAVDTACSSSLYAIHLACESLRRGECRAALAGGVNLSLHPYKYIGLSKGRFAATDGRCRSFGEGGDGYVPGEGVGAVLLKPLSAALTDQDHISAVIRGSSVNHGGKTSGYTVPNPNAQAELIRRAFRRSGLEPSAVNYVEAHGTGTVLGDPIEIAGLTKAWGQGWKAQSCAIGSVKSNIGHLESAAGIAALTKVLLQLQHATIVPTLHCERPNPNIDFKHSPFRLIREPVAWTTPELAGNSPTKRATRVAAISSFGAGGSNAHLLIEEFSPPSGSRVLQPPSIDHPELIVLSAKNQERLKVVVEDFARFLADGMASVAVAGSSGSDGQRTSRGVPATEFTLGNLAFTLQRGREPMSARLALVALSLADLERQLRGFLEGSPDAQVTPLGLETKTAGDLRALSRAGKFEEIARRWMGGLEVDWSVVNPAAGKRRISLPTYPFARERCWIHNGGSGPASAHFKAVRSGKNGTADDQPVVGVAPGLDLGDRFGAKISGPAPTPPTTAISAREDNSAAPVVARLREPELSAQSLVVSSPAKAPAAVSDAAFVLDRLKAIFSEHLRIAVEKLDDDAPFDEFGVDSLFLAELVERIETMVEDHFDPSVFLEYSTLAKLADYLVNRFGAKAFDRTPPVAAAPVQPPAMVVEPMLSAKVMAMPIVPRENVKVADAGVARVLGRLKAVFSEHLRIEAERLDDHAPFDEFGADSLFLAELVEQIEAMVGSHVDPSVFLEYSTLASLAAYLVERFGAQAFGLPAAASKPAIETPVSLAASLSSPLVIDPERTVEIPIVSAAPRETVAASAPSGSLVAVVGYWCHFPGAMSPEAFWDNLSRGVCSIREAPPERWEIGHFFNQTPQPGRTYSKWGGFLEDIEWFDPAFFKIREREAAGIDPLVRQFLEVGAQAFRHAGYHLEEISGRPVGVFVGSRAANFASKLEGFEKGSIAGLGQNFVAAYLSHFCNLKGPSLVLDSACSSSLVAVHLAIQSLLTEESEMALAGGVDILLDEQPYLLLSASKALSPDGKCHTFDAKANGFVPGEGCGAVVLKRLDKARRDGDHIYAVIEASAVNNDGHTMGVTTPDLEAQKEVTRAALRRSGVDPRTITYIETHGTGTMIGDPVELKGLTQVFSAFTPERQFCAVGSVKTNLGHLLNAAGAAGLLKVLVALEHRQLPPTLNCENPNPRFDFGQSPFYPVTRLEPWEGVNGVLRAAVTSLGFGGTNAHLILSRPVEPAVPSRRSPLPPLKFNRARLWPRPAKTPAPVDPKAAGLGSLLEERASGAALGSADEAPTVIMNSQSPRWQAPAAARRPLLSLEEEVAGA